MSREGHTGFIIAADPSFVPDSEQNLLARELAYHEKLYSGFAQLHFARPAVRALRQHMVDRILGLTGAGKTSRVLSIGCGIGDTELLLAPHVAQLTGVDLSPSAIRQANADAARLGIRNVTFIEGTAEAAHGPFDMVFAIFLLHHLSDHALAEFPAHSASILTPGGVFYSLDPSRHRASGAVGRLLIPSLMKKYQTDDERELDPEETRRLFGNEWSEVRTDSYDFGSSPMAGLFPGWRGGYQLSRKVDDLLLRGAFFRKYGSNFELIARRR
jgi:SAM-dependent methyltransferase